MRLLRVSFLTLAAAQPVAAQDVVKPDIAALVRAGEWGAAETAASALPDGVAAKVVRLRRLLLPGGASAAEIASFASANPTWPMMSTLARRRDEAIAADADDNELLGLCASAAPPFALASARTRCADVFARSGRPAEAAGMLRHAWIDGPSDAAWEARFMQRAVGSITSADQWRRFDRIAWTDTAGAARQAARLDAADKPRAEARLAFRRDDVSAPALAAALPADQRADPVLVLEQARWLARAGQDNAAVALWRDLGAAAERAAPPDRRAAFWTERNALARRLLRVGDAADAYAVASSHAQTSPEPVSEAEFLAGFVALRRLGDPEAARRHFTALASVATAPISQARAQFWLGRTAAARGDAAAAAASFRQAAQFPTTYYGQLAASALGEGELLYERIGGMHDPVADPARALALAGRELARAASLLVIWGEPRLAASFLLRLADETVDDNDRMLTAQLAQALGLPDIAVAIARRVGRDGVVLPDAGWPIAAEMSAQSGVDPALALGIIRQESSFYAGAVSPAGARGLMQLMAGTAAETARQLAIPVSGPALTSDPALNVRIGTAFLRNLLDRYGGSIPLAVAAYNAGPRRVADWVGANGDPRAESGDAIDWIELIGFGETRNYVQRVIENTVIYRAKLGEHAPHPLSQWLR